MKLEAPNVIFESFEIPLVCKQLGLGQRARLDVDAFVPDIFKPQNYIHCTHYFVCLIVSNHSFLFIVKPTNIFLKRFANLNIVIQTSNSYKIPYDPSYSANGVDLFAIFINVVLP
jgi:hypothetical protein